MSPDFHTEGQITCNPFLARLNTDNCWIAKEKVETRNCLFLIKNCIKPNAKSFITINLESPHEIQHIGKATESDGDYRPGNLAFSQINAMSALNDRVVSLQKAIQGMPTNCHHSLKKLTQRWVTAFYVAYSNDNTKWKLFKSRIERSYMTTFEGNSSIT